MSSIFKFFRITFFLVLYFLLCMVVVSTMLQDWPDGGQMLFAFGVPVILVWWQEKRRSRKVAEQAKGSSEHRTSRSEPKARPSAYDKRVERERGRTRAANVSKVSAATQAYSPPKQDYAEIVRAGKSAAPALAGAQAFQNEKNVDKNLSKIGLRLSAQVAKQAQPCFAQK